MLTSILLYQRHVIFNIMVAYWIYHIKGLVQPHCVKMYINTVEDSSNTHELSPNKVAEVSNE